MSSGEVLIVGGGLGAYRVASQLRARLFDGAITVLCGEDQAPYDRPPLSKQVLRGERDATAFPDLDQLDVHWVLGARAEDLDTSGTQVTTQDGQVYSYERLVLAPGGRPRGIPGIKPGPGVTYLRTLDDALSLRTAMASADRVIAIGGGFIGCETAASARALGVDVDLVEALPQPLIRVLGETAAVRVRELHESHGVRFHCGVGVRDVCRDDTGQVIGLRLADDTFIAGSHITVGIGIVPSVEWLSGSGIDLDDGIICDARGRTSVDNVYALGDAARWWHPLAGSHRRVEHWTSTADQAGIVAASIVSGDVEEITELSDPPYFWSDQYDLKIQGMGFIDPADQVDEIRVRDRSVLLYSRDDVVRGVVGFSIPAAVMRSKSLIARGATLAETMRALTGQQAGQR